MEWFLVTFWKDGKIESRVAQGNDEVYWYYKMYNVIKVKSLDWLNRRYK